MHDRFLMPPFGNMNNFNVELYSASIDHSLFYFKDMTVLNIVDDYILKLH